MVLLGKFLLIVFDQKTKIQLIPLHEWREEEDPASHIKEEIISCSSLGETVSDRHQKFITRKV